MPPSHMKRDRTFLKKEEKLVFLDIDARVLAKEQCSSTHTLRHHCGSHAARAIDRIGVRRWHMKVSTRAQRFRFAGGGCAF